MNDLKTEEGRKEAIREIEKSFLTEMKNNGIELSDDAVCTIQENKIVLGIGSTGKYAEKGFKIAFASDIDLYAKIFNDKYYGKSENEINFGSSGSFTPSERESYWKIIHAASILKNWDTVSEIVNQHCKMYSDLRDKIFLVNNV